MNELGVKIKNKRKELGIRQYQLAKLVGVSAPTISDWEAGNTSPKGKNLWKLAAALKTTAGVLLDEEKSSNSDITDSEAYQLLLEATQKGLSDEVVHYLKYLVNQPAK
jgi:transcriptional regulator with XRE-family HTH domain